MVKIMNLSKFSKEEQEFDTIISKFNELSKGDKVDLISYLVNDVKKLHGINEYEIFGKHELIIPIGVFGNDALSSLEAIVKYLKEDLKLRLSKIGRLLNRSIKTIWTTYKNASKKMPSAFSIISKDILIPVSIFANRSFSTLENLVGYLKDLDYSNHEVGVMLHLDDRTIWSVYDKVKKKRGMEIDK